MPARPRCVRARPTRLRSRRPDPRRRRAALAGDRLLLAVTSLSSVAVNVELARQHWREGQRRLEAARNDAVRHARLESQVDLLTAALRGRVGQTFTLEELASAYEGAEDWARALLDHARPEEGPPPEAAARADAAFHLHARAAPDSTPRRRSLPGPGG